jgi:hypothetical protein
VELIEAEARRMIGTSGVAFLSRILRDGKSVTELAAMASARGSAADTRQVGGRFRWLLEELAAAWAAKGPERARIRGGAVAAVVAAAVALAAWAVWRHITNR